MLLLEAKTEKDWSGGIVSFSLLHPLTLPLLLLLPIPLHHIYKE